MLAAGKPYLQHTDLLPQPRTDPVMWRKVPGLGKGLGAGDMPWVLANSVQGPGPSLVQQSLREGTGEGESPRPRLPPAVSEASAEHCRSC